MIFSDDIQAEIPLNEIVRFLGSPEVLPILEAPGFRSSGDLWADALNIDAAFRLATEFLIDGDTRHLEVAQAILTGAIHNSEGSA